MVESRERKRQTQWPLHRKEQEQREKHTRESKAGEEKVAEARANAKVQDKVAIPEEMLQAAMERVHHCRSARTARQRAALAGRQGAVLCGGGDAEAHAVDNS